MNSEKIVLRISPELKSAIEKRAAILDRSVSSYFRHLAIEESGYEPVSAEEELDDDIEKEQ